MFTASPGKSHMIDETELYLEVKNSELIFLNAQQNYSFLWIISKEILFFITPFQDEIVKVSETGNNNRR